MSIIYSLRTGENRPMVSSAVWVKRLRRDNWVVHHSKTFKKHVFPCKYPHFFACGGQNLWLVVFMTYGIYDLWIYDLFSDSAQPSKMSDRSQTGKRAPLSGKSGRGDFTKNVNRNFDRSSLTPFVNRNVNRNSKNCKSLWELLSYKKNWPHYIG